MNESLKSKSLSSTALCLV